MWFVVSILMFVDGSYKIPGLYWIISGILLLALIVVHFAYVGLMYLFLHLKARKDLTTMLEQAKKVDIRYVEQT